MSIAIATIVAAVIGVSLQNLTGWLGNKTGFDLRKAISSGIIAIVIGIPVIAGGFTAAFSDVESIPEEAQLVLFTIQVGAIAGFGAFAKGGAISSSNLRSI